MKLPWEHKRIPGCSGPAIYTSINEREIEMLQQLARGNRVLEVGSAHGFAAIAMAVAGAVQVITIDPHQGEVADSLACLRQNIRAYLTEDVVHPMIAYSQHVLPRLVEANAYFDLIFVDGDHAEASVAADVTAAVQMIGQYGQVVCHDYGEETCPGVKKAIDQLPGVIMTRAPGEGDTLAFVRMASLGFDLPQPAPAP